MPPVTRPDPPSYRDTSLPSPLGEPLPRVEGRDKVTGRTRFAGDWPLPPGTCWAVSVRSPWPHARIGGIDARFAFDAPGVLGVFGANDLPDARSGQVIQDVPLVARGRALYHGERVAVVVAETQAEAEAAATLVTVDYEPLPALLDPEQALGGTELHPGRRELPGMDPAAIEANVQALVTWELGDPDAAWDEAPVRHSGHWSTAPIHQGYLEPHTCLATWSNDAGLVLVSANKAPFLLERLVRPWIGPDAPLEVLRPAVGGDFGGKAFPLDEGLALVLARRLGRPVAMTMTYPEEFQAANPRHASRTVVRVACTPEGKLLVLDVDAVFDGGAYAGHKAQPVLTGIRSVAAAYEVPHVRVRARTAYTNTTPGGYMRAPAGPQLAFAVESALDALAQRCGVDPREFRVINRLRPGGFSVAGWTLERDAVTPVLDALPPGASGYALAEKPVGGGRSGVVARLAPNGMVEIETSACDPGTGAWTILAQLAAATLGIAPDQVTVRTDGRAFDSGAAASRVTHVAGRAVTTACAALHQRLITLASLAMDREPQAVRLTPAGFAADGALLPLPAVAAELGSPLPEEREDFDGGRSTGAPCYAGAAAWASVDPETGTARISRLVVVHDTGPVLNPVTATGQAEGAAVMALGQVFSEAIRRDHGQVVTTNLDTYRMAAARDVPRVEVRFVGEPAGPGPHGARPVSEVGLAAVAAAVANALRVASGQPCNHLPLGAEDLWERGPGTLAITDRPEMEARS